MWGLAPSFFMKTLISIPIGIVGVYLLFTGLVPQQKPIAPPLRNTPAPFVLSASTKSSCIPFPAYPDTRICPDKKMYHIQPGGWAFMGDLSEPHKGLPPLHPIRERGKESHAYTKKQNPLLARFTTRIAGRVPTFYCGGTGGYGSAQPETGEMWVNSTFCHPLEQLAQGVYKHPVRQGVGLLTLVHEALHVRGIWNEARTECVALQNIDNVARWWHVPLWWQDVILPIAYEDSYSLQQVNREYYSPKCREDGPWDQTKYDGRWP